MKYPFTTLITVHMGVGLLAIASVLPAFCEQNLASFSLSTKTFRMDYSVAKDGSLQCAMKKADGSGDLPVGGHVTRMQRMNTDSSA